jgi:hypothetical protein
MRAAFIMIVASVLITACDQGKPPEKLFLGAFENVGVQPDSPQPIVGDARTRLPSILQRCGVLVFERVEATDSFVGFQFEADVETERCISKLLPPGAELRSEGRAS